MSWRWLYNYETGARTWTEIVIPGWDREYVPPPAALIVATPIDPSHPGVPGACRRAAQAAVGGAWAHDLRWAVGPDEEITYGLRAARNGVQLAMTWTYKPAHWTQATKVRVPRWILEEWKNDGAWLRKGGLHAEITHTEALKELRAYAGED